MRTESGSQAIDYSAQDCHKVTNAYKFVKFRTIDKSLFKDVLVDGGSYTITSDTSYNVNWLGNCGTPVPSFGKKSFALVWTFKRIKTSPFLVTGIENNALYPASIVKFRISKTSSFLFRKPYTTGGAPVSIEATGGGDSIILWNPKDSNLSLVRGTTDLQLQFFNYRKSWSQWKDPKTTCTFVVDDSNSTKPDNFHLEPVGSEAYHPYFISRGDKVVISGAGQFGTEYLGTAKCSAPLNDLSRGTGKANAMEFYIV